jgi:hypothetical protein
MSGPYAYAAPEYWRAGWRSVLPLPPNKKANPPDDYTGRKGTLVPSWADVYAWMETRPNGNIALRLPQGVIGLDIDEYDGKPGGATLRAKEQQWGELPVTWRSTSRDNVSGIRLFRVPQLPGGVELRWPGSFGPGTETIHYGHRYVVVPPSIHDKTGKPYRWIAPDGQVTQTPPRVADLPELPWAWVKGLTEGREAHTYQGAGMDDAEIEAWIREHGQGEPCQPVSDASDRLLEDMRGGAHESLRYLMQLVGLAASGHDGLLTQLPTLRATFIKTAGPRRQGGEPEAAHEWRSSLFGAVDKVLGEMAKTGTPTSRIDPCEVLYSPAVVPSVGVVVSPAEASDTATRYDSPPGSVQDATDEPSDENSLDIAAEDAPRELTAEEAAELAALEAHAKREQAIAKAEYELDIKAEAKARREARNAPAIELLDIDEFLARPRPKPLVEGLLYRNSLSRIFGSPGCGKSFVGVDLALRLALGWAWNGSQVEQSKVVYVMAEGDAVNNERVQAWMDRHQVTADDLRGRFLSVPHKVLLLEEAIGPFIEKIKGQGVDLVILDTKNRMMIGNENHSEDNAAMVRAIDAIRLATEACVLLIDHTGLTVTGRAKGDNSTEGSMETEAEVVNDKASPPKINVKVTRDKAREVGREWDFFLRHHPIEIDGELVPTAVLLPMGDDVVLPAKRLTAQEVESIWLDWTGPIPTEVLHHEGGPAVEKCLPDLARFMAHDAGEKDPGRVGQSMGDAVTALSEKALGKGRGHSRGTVRRAWSALRDLGYIIPVEADRAEDPEKYQKAIDEKTTGKHVWSRR